MDVVVIILQGVTLFGVGALLVLSTRGLGVSRRQSRREVLAKLAVDSEPPDMAGDSLYRWAVSAFGRLDEADNQKRDYSDAEAGLAVRAAMKRKTEKGA